MVLPGSLLHAKAPTFTFSYTSSYTFALAAGIMHQLHHAAFVIHHVRQLQLQK
jgi:hypothetical protein